MPRLVAGFWIGKDPEMYESIEALVAQLKLGQVAERLAVAAALRKHGVESAAARVALVEALTDEYP